MTKDKIKVLISSAFLVIVVCCTQTQQPVNNSNNANNTTAGNVGDTRLAPCNASVDWVNNPQSAPMEIPNNGQTLCDFHQFSWRWFLAMMNTNGETRVFQNGNDYPLYLGKGKDSCAPTSVKTRLFVRTRKDDDPQSDDFVLPESVGQAGGDAIIYDQNKNIVFYEARFSRTECTQDPTQAQFTDPVTTEIKVSYRVIMEADKPNYVWINADINADGYIEAKELLGMVGFHLVRSTKLHPEFVWATFEHKQNVPECQATPDPNAKPWSFTSAACANQLPNPANQLCGFNNAATPTASPTPTPMLAGGTPTEICRVYHNGTSPNDNQAPANNFDINTLNTQLVGPTGFITALPDSNPLAVLKNYMLVGALWESEISQPSSNLENQRGSIQLANSTMETTYQQAPNFTPQPYTGTSNLQPATNCFACHAYTPGQNVSLSHIFPYIKGQQKTD